jgi:putative ABC transport system ATP-binding protein
VTIASSAEPRTWSSTTAQPNEALLRWSQIGRVFTGPPAVRALEPTTLTVHDGDYVAIVGRSGAGKSTMLNLLGLLDTPSEGSYFLNGQDVTELSDSDRASLRASFFGFVFQAFHLLTSHTVVENVELGMLYRGARRRERRRAAMTAVERVGLMHRATAYPSTLSGGERQRVAVARALVGGPRVLFCDEPTGNLDSATAAGIFELIEDLWRQGLTLIVVSHDVDVARRARRVFTVHDGTAREDGT